MVSLKKWNGYAAIVHIVIAVFLIVYFLYQNSKAGDDSQIDTSLYDIVTDGDLVKAEKKTKGSIGTIQMLIIAFVVITAIFHIFYYLNINNSYAKAIGRNNNSFRWIEYSITATIMVVAILVLSGVKSWDTTILAVVSTIVIMLQGDIVEKALARGSKSDTIIPTFVGWILLLAVFYIIFRNFSKRLQEARDSGFELPKWLNGVVWPMLIWFGCFGVIQLVQIFKGGKYVKYEKTYVVFSLAAKAFLALFVAYGLGRRNEP